VFISTWTFLCHTFAMEPFVAIPNFFLLTIMDIVNDSSPFTSTSPPKNNKKQCTDKQDHIFAQHKFKMLIWIYSKRCPGPVLNLTYLSTSNKSFSPWWKANFTLSILSLDRKLTYHPSHDNSPASEEYFQGLFFCSSSPNHTNCSSNYNCWLYSPQFKNHQ